MLLSMAAASEAQSVSPTSISLKPSETQNFSVQNASQNVYFWSISPSSGTISVAGLYQAPANINSLKHYSVTAASLADPTKTSVGTITNGV
jgi:hypothetical protein